MKKQKLWKIINEKVDCKKGCHECCTIAPFTNKEFEAIPANLKEGIKWLDFGDNHKIAQAKNDDGINCPFLKKDNSNKQCGIYEYRPFVCKAFGRLEGLTCSYGANAKNLIKRKDVGKFDKEFGITDHNREELKLMKNMIRQVL